MSKLIQAYFRTEDEAEGARTTLMTYHTEQLEVGALQGGIDRGVNVLVPLIPWGTGAGTGTPGTGNIGTVGAHGAVISTRSPVSDDSGLSDDDFVETDDWKDSDFDELRYVLSVKVNDEDYEEIVQKLRKNHAFVERFD